MKLKDKVVLITGGGSGLGREMGLTFAREGASVGVNDIRPESAQNVVTEIERAGGKARPFVADVSSSEAVRKMFADFIAAFGTIDILINNAGIGRTRDTSEVIPTYQKTDANASPVVPATEPILMMRPDCFGIITLSASRVQKNVESRCVASILCHSSSVFW